MKKGDRKAYLTAVSVLVGTCIGAGVLGIPYVAAQAGFFVALGYLTFLAFVIMCVNLYLGEVSLRTKGDHQIAGYAEMYLGPWGKYVLDFATIFGVYAAILAYLVGVGESVSFLLDGNGSNVLFYGLLFGGLMSLLLWRGMRALKRFERLGVLIILSLLLAIFFLFVSQVSFSHLTSWDSSAFFLPFGVILFALMSFHAIPELEIILHKREYLMRPALITGTCISFLFYVLFVFIVVGYMGHQTPEIATLALGPLFVLLGIFTIFTSYLSLGNALFEHFLYDERMSKGRSWGLTALIPLILFSLLQYIPWLSFTKLLGIGGVVSGGTIGILVILMAHKAKKHGNRKPEYSIPLHWWISVFFSLVFLFGMALLLI